MFFLAFLPQFADPQVATIAVQLMFLCTVYAFVTFCRGIMVAMLSDKLGKLIAHYQKFTIM